MWVIDVNGLGVLDLRRPEVLRALGVELSDLTAARERAQPLADLARRAGANGIVAPSAARPDHWSLVVFPAGFDRLSVARSQVMHPAPPTD